MDNVFQANDCDAFDSDVDEAPMTQTMFMANLSSADPVYDEAGPSYDSDILSEVHDHDYYQDAVCEHHEKHEMHDDVQPNYVVDSHSKIFERIEQVKLYERRARFELTEREQKIDEQLRIVITDRNIKEENLKKELHSVKMQLASIPSTITSQWKHDEIERKNILIANDNLIVDCLSKEVFYITTNSELTVSRFTEMHEAHTIIQTRCLELEAKLSKRYDHTELVKRFSNLEITRAKHIEQTTDNGLCNKNKNLKAQIHENLKCNTMESVKPRVLAPSRYAIDVGPIPPHNRKNKEVHLYYLKHLKESVETLRKIVEEAKVERPFDRSTISAFKQVWKPKQVRKVWKPTGKVLTSVGHQWRPTGRIFTLGERYPLTRLTKLKVVSTKQTEHQAITCAKPKEPNKIGDLNFHKLSIFVCFQMQVVQIILWYLDSGCSKHMTGDRSRLRNFMKKFIGTVRFKNDHFGAIMGYGDYVIGDSVISRVYYVEGLGHNLFSVSLGSNFYTISVEDMMKSSPIFLLSKASKNKSWLWHRRLNHLNFGTINDLARKDLVRGLPRLKFEKDHFCSACQLGKSKKHTHKPKTENTNLEVLNTLHMDLCGPMRVQTINGKKYILVIVDDYSRFTWVKFLRSKDETPKVVIKFLKQIQVGLNKTIRYIRTDNGTKFVNKDLTAYYERVGIFYEKTVPRTLQQNVVIERQNHTLVEAARTMLIFSKALMFLWVEAVATALLFVTLQMTAKILENYNQQLILEYSLVMHLAGKGLAPTFLTLGQISSGLIPNPVPAAPYVPPTNKELEILFQLMFDEYLEPPHIERPVFPAPAVPVPVNSAGIPSSTNIDQDAPSPSHSPSSSALHSLSSHQGVAVGSTITKDNPFAPVTNNPFENSVLLWN
ncbi:retrovirus-related pol polyprotein from transposon TNT 1-94 [Tanacetum coccineum]